jgi:protein-tyrosine-phosphatase
MRKPQVLFICLGNSCRSIMAEALTKQLCGERWDAASAGLNPLGWVANETKEVLKESGVDPDGLRSKGLDEINLADYRLLVNLSEYSLNRLIPAEYEDRLIQRPMPDPFGGSLQDYRASREAIKQMIFNEFCQGELPLRSG